MLQDGADLDPLGGVRNKDALHQIPALGRDLDIRWEGVIHVDDALHHLPCECVGDCGVGEGQHPKEHDVQDDAAGPDVCESCIVACGPILHRKEQLRGCVGWAAHVCLWLRVQNGRL